MRIRAKVLSWGNSCWLRFRKVDLERLGLRPGDEVLVRFEGAGDAVDLSELPTFKGGTPDDSLRHDELHGKARLRQAKKSE
jgi:hypothetical protein